MWISLRDAWPVLGLYVAVTGKYVSRGTGHPLSKACLCSYGQVVGRGQHAHFESREWRGCVGVLEWWYEPDEGEKVRYDDGVEVSQAVA